LRSLRPVQEDAMPTATARDFLDMAVTDVRRIPAAGRDHYVVLLQEAGDGRRLPN
jgi:hypothetical protein